MKKFRQIAIVAAAVVLSMVMVVGLTACDSCAKPNGEATYTYQDYTSGNPNKWNPHTWESTEDSYIMSYTQMGLYDFILNDDKTGYEIFPEMAAEMATDVTGTYKGRFGIPADAQDGDGYAYKIPLNQNAKWDDGTPITAEDWVYSAQQLLSSEMQNYRASTMFEGQLVYAGAKNYFRSKAPIYAPVSPDGENLSELPADAQIYYSLSKVIPMFGLSINTLYSDYIGSFERHANSIDAVLGSGKAVAADKALAELAKLDNGYGMINKNAETTEKFKLVVNAALFSGVFSGITEDDLITDDNIGYVSFYFEKYGDEFSWENVGLQKTGEYEITIMLEAPVKDFYLYYNLATPWLVKKDVYEACKVKAAGSAVYTSTYCTTDKNTPSFGPYKLTRFQLDKEIYLEKNENWYGYTDGKHVGQFQTTAIRCRVVANQATALNMFLKGELDNVALTSSNVADYREGKYTKFTPDSSTWKLSFNMNEAALKDSQDKLQDGSNKTIMANADFRKAIVLSIDKNKFVAQNFPASQPAFGLINYMYVINPETGELYRDTQAAKETLVEYYGLEYGEGKEYSTLDAAYAAMTGYDPDEAKRLFQKAYDDMVAAGKMKKDEKVKLRFNMYSDDDIYQSVFTFITNAVVEAAKDTSLEGKIEFERIVDPDFYKTMQSGGTEIIMSAWGGANFDPFGVADCYLNPDKSNENGFPFETEKTFSVGGKSYTLTLQEWSEALNGKLIKNDETITFTGESVETKLEILAMLEKEVLETSIVVPLWYVTGASMNSMRVVNALDEYMQLIGYGGVRYITYTHSDQAWAEFTNNYSKQLNYTVSD